DRALIGDGGDDHLAHLFAHAEGEHLDARRSRFDGAEIPIEILGTRETHDCGWNVSQHLEWRRHRFRRRQMIYQLRRELPLGINGSELANLRCILGVVRLLSAYRCDTREARHYGEENS